PLACVSERVFGCSHGEVMSVTNSLMAESSVARLAALPGVSTASGVAAAAEQAQAAGRVLPVLPVLRKLLPAAGLRRGSTVAVGMPGLGLVAAGELGVEVSRLALVPRPGAEFASVTAALLDGVDLVAVSSENAMPGQARRLSARARHRGAVLLSLGPWPGAEV